MILNLLYADQLLVEVVGALSRSCRCRNLSSTLSNLAIMYNVDYIVLYVEIGSKLGQQDDHTWFMVPTCQKQCTLSGLYYIVMMMNIIACID